MSLNKYFQIDKTTRLTSDKYQFIIETGTVVKDKESPRCGLINWSNEAFLPKIEDVLRWLADRDIKSNIENIHVAANWTKDLESKLKILVEANQDYKENI